MADTTQEIIHTSVLTLSNLKSTIWTKHITSVSNQCFRPIRFTIYVFLKN